MLIIQILFLAVFLVALLKVVGRYRHKELSLSSAVIWCLFWLGGVLVVLMPNSTFYLARFVGVTRGADVIVYGALVLVFFLIFKVTIKLERQDKEITFLTRQISLYTTDDNNKDVLLK
jgi:hypothetical protein